MADEIKQVPIQYWFYTVAKNGETVSCWLDGPVYACEIKRDFIKSVKLVPILAGLSKKDAESYAVVVPYVTLDDLEKTMRDVKEEVMTPFLDLSEEIQDIKAAKQPPPALCRVDLRPCQVRRGMRIVKRKHKFHL